MATYLLKDSNGVTLATLPGVLDNVPLTGVSTNTTSGTANIITVASTVGLFPGMPVSIPNVPSGALIHAIRSATQIELYRSAWDATNGVFTTSGANANATAVGTDLVGVAHGFDPRCLVAQTYAQGVWRNLTNGGAANNAYGQGVATVPTSVSIGTGQMYGIMYPATASPRLSDTLAEIPLKRHNGEPWSCRMVVHTGGHLSTVPANPEYTMHYNGADA